LVIICSVLLRIIMDNVPEKLGREDLIGVVKNAPLVSVDLVVRNGGGRVLLGWRSNRPARDCWFVPGGRILKNERISQAFERIAKDELGAAVSFDDARLIGVFDHIYEDNFAGEGEFGTHYVVLAYEVRVEEAALDLPNDQHSKYQWFTAESADKDEKVHPNTRVYFEKFC